MSSTPIGSEVLSSLRALHLSALFTGEQGAIASTDGYIPLKTLQGYSVSVAASSPLTRKDGDTYITILDYLYSSSPRAALDRRGPSPSHELRFTWPELLDRCGAHHNGSSRKELHASLSRLVATVVRIVTPDGSGLETNLISSIEWGKGPRAEIRISLHDGLLRLLQRETERVALPAAARAELRVKREDLAKALMDTALAHKQRTVRLALRDLVSLLNRPASTPLNTMRRSLRSALTRLQSMGIVEAFELPERALDVSITITRQALKLAASGDHPDKESDHQASLFDN